MLSSLFRSLLVVLYGMVSVASGSELNPTLAAFVQERVAEFDEVSADRSQSLQRLAQYIVACQQNGDPIRLTFICTHNSRRSHMAQLWCAAAAAHFGFEGVTTYSGGTEATAFNPRAVAALRQAGFLIAEPKPVPNPQYTVRLTSTGEPMRCFSKVYDSEPNPQSDYCAIMTCSEADQSCPSVAGAAERIAIPYEDPKSSDGTPQEAEMYNARCEQIAREMLYVFENASKTKSR